MTIIYERKPSSFLTHKDIVELLRFAENEFDVDLTFTDALDLVATGRQPLQYRDFAEYIVDAINEHADVGEWYTLTNDYNIEKETSNGT